MVSKKIVFTTICLVAVLAAIVLALLAYYEIVSSPVGLLLSAISAITFGAINVWQKKGKADLAIVISYIGIVVGASILIFIVIYFFLAIGEFLVLMRGQPG